MRNGNKELVVKEASPRKLSMLLILTTIYGRTFIVLYYTIGIKRLGRLYIIKKHFISLYL